MAYLGNVPAEAYTSIDKQVITGDGGTSYTLDHSVANENEIEVFVNNVRQEPSVAYTVSGTALTMTGNVESSDDFYVVFQGKAVQTTSHPEGQDLKARDGTFSGVITAPKFRTTDDGIETKAGTNVSMSSTGDGQLKLDGSGYTGAIALDATGMHLYHNSSSRALIFGTNETERMRITGGGTVQVGDSSVTDVPFGVANHSSHVQMRVGDNGGALGSDRTIRFQGRNAVDDANAYADLTLDPDAREFIIKAPKTNSPTINGLKMDSDGRVLLPNQPSAVCYFGDTNAYVQETQSWIFDNTEYNIGNHYSTSTGRFTAPVAGIYQVSFFTLSGSTSDAYYLVVRKNGTEQGRAYQYTRAGQMHMQVKCNANDYLQVGTDGTSKSFYHGRHYTKASFHLLG